MAKKSVGPGRPAYVSPLVLVALSNAREATVSELGATPVVMNTLLNKGFVETTGDLRRSGSRGRPAQIFRPTEAGRKEARRLKDASRRAAKRAEA